MSIPLQVNFNYAIGSFIRKENSARGVSVMNDCVFSSVLEELCCCIRGEAKDENLIKNELIRFKFPPYEDSRVSPKSNTRTRGWTLEKSVSISFYVEIWPQLTCFRPSFRVSVLTYKTKCVLIERTLGFTSYVRVGIMLESFALEFSVAHFLKHWNTSFCTVDNAGAHLKYNLRMRSHAHSMVIQGKSKFEDNVFLDNEIMPNCAVTKQH